MSEEAVERLTSGSADEDFADQLDERDLDVFGSFIEESLDEESE